MADPDLDPDPTDPSVPAVRADEPARPTEVPTPRADDAAQRSDEPAQRSDEPAQRSDEDERNARAKALLDEAQQAALEHGRAVVAEARAVRRRMLEDADARRREVIAELERLRTTIDETIAALQVAPEDVTPPPAARETVREDAGPVPAASTPPSSEEPTDPRATALFDQLRAAPLTPRTEPKKSRTQADGATKTQTKKAPAKRAKPVAEPTPAAASGAPAEPAPPVQAAEALASPASAPDASAALPGEEAADPAAGRPETGTRIDPALQRRGTLVDPLVPDVVRASKRLLQDEQNSLLDAVRRARGKHEADRLLPEPVRQREAWTALLAPAFNAAYLGGRAAAGKTGRVSSAPDRVVIELAAALVNPLRERITLTIDAVVSEGPYESPAELQRALGSAIGARYREWRSRDLEDRIIDVLDAAYARGAYEASGPAAMLQWLPDEPGRCPDCDDNALEPTLKGKPFPTGQTHPPAHPGCRCLALPVGP